MKTRKTQKDQIKINEGVRKSQVVLQYGVGAMIDFRDSVLMTADSEFWSHDGTNDYEIIRDERLEKLLGVSKLISPSVNGVAFTRFPEWYFCPKCRKFQPLDKWEADLRKVKTKDKEWIIKNIRCDVCNVSLVPARIVVACPNGHIDDFPWVEWVHARAFGGEKPICDNSKLKFKTTPNASSGLEGLTIECSCGAKATLRNSFDNNIFKILSEKGKIDFRCTGKHPHNGSQEDCAEFPKTLQRGASSVYFPCTVSSLLIPPYSERIRQAVLKSKAMCDFEIIFFDRCLDVGFDEIKFLKKRLAGLVTQVAEEIGSKEVIVEPMVRGVFEKNDSDNETYATEQRYKWEEYKALTGIVPVGDLKDDFIQEVKDGAEYEIKGIKTISLIRKLKETVALTGFSRIEPTFWSPTPHAGYVSVKNTKVNAYPAVESQGEGVFIQFKIGELDNWINSNPKVAERAANMKAKLECSFWSKNAIKIEVNSKFLLLHTLAHLLIKQLSFECGYAVAAIRERIYCGKVDNANEMAGILLYTTDSDSEGTLGGLVRQGETDTFPTLFKKAIASAVLCSNDPVCIYSEGQGLDALNLAACHACVLLPETCCEFRNVLLDRGIVIGTFEQPEIGYYSDLRDKIYD